jgi:hypothetical protein
MASRLDRARTRVGSVLAALVLFAVFVPGVAASSHGSLSFTKTCTPDLCTVAGSSETGLVPNGSTLTYSGPRFDPHLSSAFVLDTGDGSAKGHCSLAWSTGIGRCVIDGGSGSLAGLHAVLSEWVDFGTGDFASFVFHLDGSYHID